MSNSPMDLKMEVLFTNRKEDNLKNKNNQSKTSFCVKRNISKYISENNNNVKYLNVNHFANKISNLGIFNLDIKFVF